MFYNINQAINIQINYTTSEKNYQNIPYELKERNQWVRFDADKRPLNAATGQYASSTNPATWASFDEAVNSPHGIGIGFVFSESDLFTGIDLDAPEGQQLSPEQLNIIEYFSSYTEYSVSGRGVHIIVKGALPEGCRKAGIEIYSHGRYFTFTGNSFHSQPLPVADRQSELLKAYEFLKRPTCEETHIDTNQNASVITDEQVIQFICGSEVNRQHWYDTNPADWSAAYFSVLSAACAVSTNEEQIKRILTSSPLVAESSPKNGEPRLKKMLRLWPDEYPLAAAKGGVERSLEAEKVELGNQLCEGLFAKPVGNNSSAEYGRRLYGRSLDCIEERAIDWVWLGWVPRGYLTLIAGETGAGKSPVLCDIAARISTGKPWPGENETRSPERVLWLGSEDSMEDMTVPRLKACGADLKNITQIQGVKDSKGQHSAFSLQDDIQEVRAWLAYAKRDDKPFSVLVIDPITSYLSGGKLRKVDLNDNGQIRTILEPWFQVAEEFSLGIVCVTHFSKDSQRAMLHRVLNSSAFVQTCRSLVGVTNLNSEEPHSKALIQIKVNLPDHPGGAWRFKTEKITLSIDRRNGKPINATFPHWQELDCSITPDNVTGGARGPLKQNKNPFLIWLKIYFGTDLWKSSSEVRKAAIQEGIISENAWFKASSDFLIKENFNGVWRCRLKP